MITCYLTTYGIWKITKLADHLEEDVALERPNYMVTIYHEIPIVMKVKGAKVIRYLILAAAIAMCSASNIGNLSLVSTTIAQNFGLNIY